METRTKKNRVVIVRTTDGGRKNKDVIPIEFRIEITPEKELGPIEARDPEGNEYIVSISLESKTGDKPPMCCCKNKRGKKECVPLLPGQKCSCKK